MHRQFNFTLEQICSCEPERRKIELMKTISEIKRGYARVSLHELGSKVASIKQKNTIIALTRSTGANFIHESNSLRCMTWSMELIAVFNRVLQ